MYTKQLLATIFLSITLTAPALAAPYLFEFASGALTGSFTLGTPNVEAGAWSFEAWHITTPLGMVWDSSNPAQGLHENNLFGSGFTFHAELSSNPFQNHLLLETEGPTTQALDQPAGSYRFETSDGSDGAFGTGEWRRVGGSVPLPGMLWPTAAGLVLLARFMAKRRHV